MMFDRVIPMFAFLVAVGVFFGYVQPTWNGKIAETKALIEADEKALEAADAYTAKQNKLASARSAIDSANLDRLAVFLPDSVDNVGLILDLNALAARSGIVLSNVDVTQDTVSTNTAARTATAAVKVDPVGSVDLSLTAVGTYSSLQSFLMGIERSARILEVQDLSVTGSDTGVYNYRMKIRLFWLR